MHAKLNAALREFNHGACVAGNLVLFRPTVRNDAIELRAVWYAEPGTLSAADVQIVEAAQAKAQAALDALVQEISP